MVQTSGFDPVITAAIEQARRAALSSPRSAEARGRMGMVLLAHDVRPEARSCLAQATVLAPGEPRWFYFLGLAEIPDNPSAAATNLERAVELFAPSEPAPRLRLANTLLGLGRLEQAEGHYREVWKLNTNSAPAALGLAKIANARGHTAEAAEWLPLAAQDPSTRKAAHRLLVSVNQRLGRTNEAEEVARTLAELPNDAPWPDQFFAEVEALKTGEQAWVDQADEWIKTGRVTDAAKLLEKTVITYPNSDRAMFFLGRARFRLGDSAGAEQILMRAVALAPESVEAQMQLGVVRLSQGRAREAQPCFRAAVQSKPNLPEGWFNLGLSLGGDRSRTDCIAAFREAIRLKPNLLEAYLGLAIALRADGQKQEATRELERALALKPEEPLRGKLLNELNLAQRP